MRFRSFGDFYPAYLGQHTDRMCRRLHFAGTSIGLLCLALALWTRAWWLVIVGFVIGYSCAWIGHLFFEKNRPATFTHPLYSFAGDWVMWWQILTGRMKF